LPNHLTPTPYDAVINRYDGSTGAFIDTFVPTGAGGLADVRDILFDGDGNLLVAEPTKNAVLRYEGPAGQTPGRFIDAVVPSGLGGLRFPISIAVGDDLNLYVSSRDTDEVLRYGTIKFYVVNDASTDRTYEYTDVGVSGESYTLTRANSAPRGAASNITGDKVWVVDANKKSYVYDTRGRLLGSWSANGLSQPQGITTNGVDVWIVDAGVDKVFRYAGAGSRISGSHNVASSFGLASSNANPKDIVSDGVHLWVVDDSTTDKVFKYTLSGALIGSWTISGGGGSPTGITIDPANASHVWIVDNATDRVYQYSGAAARTSGSQAAAASFALAPVNTNPQGIADPPPLIGKLDGGQSTDLPTPFVNEVFQPDSSDAPRFGRVVEKRVLQKNERLASAREDAFDELQALRNLPQTHRRRLALTFDESGVDESEMRPNVDHVTLDVALEHIFRGVS
jgi:hypothetical protein